MTEQAGAMTAEAAPLAIGRPRTPLVMAHLVRLSLYWLGIQTIWSGMNVVLSKRMEALDPVNYGTLLAVITTAGVVVAIVVQPTIGIISDYTISRWGRRKPYIVLGASLDLVFLTGFATSNVFLGLVAFYMLLQLSSNFAQGPFQGYVPDLVPEEQVGMASGLMGLMIVIGQIGGAAIANVGLLLAPASSSSSSSVLTVAQAQSAFVWPTIGLGLLEFATMLSVIFVVESGSAAPPRQGRSWLQIAGSAWGTDILRERNVLRVLLVRLLFIGAGGCLSWVVLYMNRSLGLSNAEAATWYLVAVAGVGILAAAVSIPGARLSDRFGRRPVIWLGCVIGAFGLAGAAVASNVYIAVLSFVPYGIGYGIFLSVDWALMTDVIPKGTTGRYMGVLNIGTAAAGPIYLAVSGPLDTVANHLASTGVGERLAFVVGALFVILAGVALTFVDARRRED